MSCKVLPITPSSASLATSSSFRFNPQDLFFHYPVALAILETSGNFLSANITFRESFGWNATLLPSSITQLMANETGFEEKRFIERLKQFREVQKSLLTSPSQEYLFALKGFSEDIHYLSLRHCKDEQVFYTVVMTSKVGKHIFASFLPFTASIHLGSQLSPMRSSLQKVIKKLLENFTSLLVPKEKKQFSKETYQLITSSLSRLEIYLNSGAFKLPGFSSSNLCDQKSQKKKYLYNAVKTFFSYLSNPPPCSIDYHDFWQRMGTSFPCAVIELPSLTILHANGAFKEKIGGQEGSSFRNLFPSLNFSEAVKSDANETYTPEAFLIYELQTTQALCTQEQKQSSGSLSSLPNSKVNPLDSTLRLPKPIKEKQAANNSHYSKVSIYEGISFQAPETKEVTQKTLRVLRTKHFAYLSVLDIDQWLEGEYKKLDGHALISTCQQLQSLWEQLKDDFELETESIRAINLGLARLQSYLKSPLKDSQSSLDETLFDEDKSDVSNHSDMGLPLENLTDSDSQTPAAFLPSFMLSPSIPCSDCTGLDASNISQNTPTLIPKKGFDLSSLRDKWFVIVDDDSIPHRMIARDFQPAAKSYTSFFNAKDAEMYFNEVVKRHFENSNAPYPRGIVVIDYSMPPGDNGVELVKKLDALFKKYRCRDQVLLLGNTANAGEIIEQFVVHGADGAYSKSNKPALIQKVQNFYPPLD